MPRFKVSEKRNPIPLQVRLDDQTTLTSWGAIKLLNFHLFPSGFQIKSGDSIIYIDPVEVEFSAKADYILITHSHPDHFSKKDIEKLVKQDTIIVCSKGVFKKLQTFKNEIHVVKPTDSLNLEGLQIEAIAAYNVKPIFLWIKAHPKSHKNVGFILTLNNGLRIYHTGDTDYIPEMKNLSNIDIALIPIGGRKLTMNENEAARLVNDLKPGKAVPMHYQISKTEKVNRFNELVDKATEVIEMK